MEVLRGMEQAFDANLSMIMLMPLFESLSVAKDKTVRKTIEDTLSTLVPKEEDEDESLFDVGFFSRTLFDIGAEGEVADANRKSLYKLSELFKPFDAVGDMAEGGCCGCDDSACEEECSGEECSEEECSDEECSDKESGSEEECDSEEEE